MVLAAVSGRDTGATMLNTLARSGEHIQLYTPLANDEAERRLSRSPLYRTALAQANPQNGELAAALSAAQEALMSTAEKAVRQAVSLTQGSDVVFSRPDVLANALPLHPPCVRGMWTVNWPVRCRPVNSSRYRDRKVSRSSCT
ncbi:hypothetical protein ACFQUX_03110 [Pantoea stewartii]